MANVLYPADNFFTCMRELRMSVGRQAISGIALLAAAAAMFIAACSGGGGGAMPGPSPSPGQSQAPCVTQQSNHVVVASNGRTYVLRAPSAGERPAWDASRIFVRFRSSAYRPDVAARLNSLHAVPDGVADRAGFQVFDVPAGQDLDLTVASLQSMHSVIKAGKLALRYLQTTPNDPIYTGNNYQQWDLNQINMPGAWSLSIGDAAVTIAVVDTGYDIASPEF